MLKYRTLDGQIVRQSLVDAPRHNVLICRPNSLLEEQQVKDVRRSVNLMTFGASVSSVFNVASEAKVSYNQLLRSIISLISASKC
jgi:hypothetical protein